MAEPVTCELCGSTFKDRRGLRGHERLKHNFLHRQVDLPETALQLAALKEEVRSLMPQLQAGLQHVSGTLAGSIENLRAQGLVPLASDLAAIKTAVSNDLPHLLAGFKTVAAQVDEAVASPSSVEGEAAPGFFSFGNSSSGNGNPGQNAEPGEEPDSKDSDWGWLVLVGLGVWWLAYLRKKPAPPSQP